ncbi:MAG: aminopeptidase, partial [Gammaproteobacteria bacterium]|nr:aminopeptidase [Gammaproteobacteria bacterium]
PTAALAVLRELVMGRELFDHAFREYANRWKFKRPTPADFFRTMEDASGVDLDWFWRGWFYGTDHVDVEVAGLRGYQVSSQDPDVEFPLRRQAWEAQYPASETAARNATDGTGPTRVERRPHLKDFYDENDRFTPNNKDRNEYRDFRAKLEAWEREALDRAVKAGEHFYFVDFRNIGGLVTPLPLTLTYEDGSTRDLLIPAEVWRYNAVEVTKLFIEKKRLVSVEIDRKHLSADADYSNNALPRRVLPTRIELFKGRSGGRNQMLDAMAELKTEGAGADAKGAPKDAGAAVPLQQTGGATPNGSAPTVTPPPAGAPTAPPKQ